ncbi:hypothetical protein CABS03_01311 [Colletotrichum abscissum]|uniref:Uncharacterized protein n=2 Tax=Colletotrichum acutatum species complex TaxID=2707335 RepID=A0A9Q0AVI9_9PEZI|nr:hypothetical protein CABS02_12296 [Colletotrichum abscissum]KAK0375791.1 hypothetical protein CLIM01_06835 [Colletotrichum limetticola]
MRPLLLSLSRSLRLRLFLSFVK